MNMWKGTVAEYLDGALAHPDPLARPVACVTLGPGCPGSVHAQVPVK